jgi:hypothetical protein
LIHFRNETFDAICEDLYTNEFTNKNFSPEKKTTLFLDEYITKDTFKHVLKIGEKYESPTLLKACSRYLTRNPHLINDPFFNKFLNQFCCFSHSQGILLLHSKLLEEAQKKVDVTQFCKKGENGHYKLPFFVAHVLGDLILNIDFRIQDFQVDECRSFFSEMDSRQLEILENCLIEICQKKGSLKKQKEVVNRFIDFCHSFALSKLQKYLLDRYPNKIFFINPQENHSQGNPRVIHCRKERLSQASPYFHAMLNGDFREKEQRIIKTEDTELLLAVAFVTGDLVVEDDPESIESFLAVAERFQLDQLRKKLDKLFTSTAKIRDRSTAIVRQECRTIYSFAELQRLGQNSVATYQKRFIFSQTYALPRLQQLSEKMIVLAIPIFNFKQIQSFENDFLSKIPPNSIFNKAIEKQKKLIAFEYLAAWWAQAVKFDAKNIINKKTVYKFSEEERKKFRKNKNELSNFIKNQLASTVTSFNIRSKCLRKYLNHYPHTPTLHLTSKDILLSEKAGFAAQLIPYLPNLRRTHFFCNIGVNVFTALKKCRHLEMINFTDCVWAETTMLRFYGRLGEELNAICANNPNLNELQFYSTREIKNVFNVLKEIPQITRLKFNYIDTLHLLKESNHDIGLPQIKEIEIQYPELRSFLHNNLMDFELIHEIFPNLTAIKLDLSLVTFVKIQVNQKKLTFSHQHIGANHLIELHLSLSKLASHPHLSRLEFCFSSLQLVEEGKDEFKQILDELNQAGKRVILPELGFKEDPIEVITEQTHIAIPMVEDDYKEDSLEVLTEQTHLAVPMVDDELDPLDKGKEKM